MLTRWSIPTLTHPWQREEKLRQRMVLSLHRTVYFRLPQMCCSYHWLLAVPTSTRSSWRRGYRLIIWDMNWYSWGSPAVPGSQHHWQESRLSGLDVLVFDNDGLCSVRVTRHTHPGPAGPRSWWCCRWSHVYIFGSKWEGYYNFVHNKDSKKVCQGVFLIIWKRNLHFTSCS